MKRRLPFIVIFISFLFLCQSIGPTPLEAFSGLTSEQRLFDRFFQKQTSSQPPNLVVNGTFDDQQNILQKILAKIFLHTRPEGLALSWSEVHESGAKTRFSLVESGSGAGKIQKVETLGIGNGIAQQIKTPFGKPVYLTISIKVDRGTAAIEFGGKKIKVDDINWRTLLLLNSSAAVKDRTDIAIISAAPDTVIELSLIEVKELNMNGKKLEDNSSINQLKESSLSKLQSVDTTAVPIDTINQNLSVRMTMPLQVVANHCDETSPEKIINPRTNRCPLVETLARRDFTEMQRRFEGTGKTFTFSGFDDVWDQSSEQGCGQAAGGQTLPPKHCRGNQSDIHVAILHVPGESNSGGDAGGTTLRYTAPAKIGPVDYWQSLVHRSGYASVAVLTHEMGHLFQQIHAPWVPEERNEVLSKVSFELMYANDLGTYPRRWEETWAFELTKKASTPAPGHEQQIVWKSVPELINLRVLKPDGNPFPEGMYVIYGSEYQSWGAQKILSTERLRGYLNTESELSLYGTLISQYPILFVVIRSQGAVYYTWLNIMDTNLSYWAGNRSEQNISEQTLLYTPGNSPPNPDPPVVSIFPIPNITPREEFGACGSCPYDHLDGCYPSGECRFVYNIGLCTANNKPGAPCCLHDVSCTSSYQSECGYASVGVYCSKCQRFQNSPPWCSSFDLTCGGGKPASPRLKSPSDGALLSSFSPVTLSWYAFGEGLENKCGETLPDRFPSWDDCTGEVHWNSQAACIPEVGDGRNAQDRSCWGYTCSKGSFGIPEWWRFYSVLVKGGSDEEFSQVCRITGIPNPQRVGEGTPEARTSCTFTPSSSGLYQWKVQAGFTVPETGFTTFSESSVFSFTAPNVLPSSPPPSPSPTAIIRASTPSPQHTPITQSSPTLQPSAIPLDRYPRVTSQLTMEGLAGRIPLSFSFSGSDDRGIEEMSLYIRASDAPTSIPSTDGTANTGWLQLGERLLDCGSSCSFSLRNWDGARSLTPNKSYVVVANIFDHRSDGASPGIPHFGLTGYEGALIPDFEESSLLRLSFTVDSEQPTIVPSSIIFPTRRPTPLPTPQPTAIAIPTPTSISSPSPIPTSIPTATIAGCPFDSANEIRNENNQMLSATAENAGFRWSNSFGQSGGYPDPSTNAVLRSEWHPNPLPESLRGQTTWNDLSLPVDWEIVGSFCTGNACPDGGVFGANTRISGLKFACGLKRTYGWRVRRVN